MKHIIDYINEAYSQKMSKVFNSTDKLENAIYKLQNQNKIEKFDLESLTDAIYDQYRTFPNGYILSEDGKLFLALVSKGKSASGRVSNAIENYKISIFIDLGRKIDKLVFEGFKSFLSSSENNASLVDDFKSGISLNELLKKYKYNNAFSELSDNGKEFIKNINKD